jgi:hypothetical protein
MPPVIKNRLAVPPRPGTTVGMTPTRPVRSDAKPTDPHAAPAPMGVDRGTQAYTYITKAVLPLSESTPILYNGDRLWAKITLLLETAGPVVVGTRADLGPVTSGKGRQLLTGVPMEFTIGKGERLYILATAVNLVGVTVEPYAWLEQIANAEERIAKKP